MSVPLGRLSRRPASSPGANPQLSSEKGRVSEMDGVEQQLRKLGGNLTGTLTGSGYRRLWSIVKG